MIMVQKMRTDWSANYYKICCVLKEILEEVVRELQKVKEEIIDGRVWGGGEQFIKCMIIQNKCVHIFSVFQNIYIFPLFLLAIRRELLRIGST